MNEIEQFRRNMEKAYQADKRASHEEEQGGNKAMTKREMLELDRLRVRDFLQIQELDIRRLSYKPGKHRWFRHVRDARAKKVRLPRKQKKYSQKYPQYESDKQTDKCNPKQRVRQGQDDAEISCRQPEEQQAHRHRS